MSLRRTARLAALAAPLLALAGAAGAAPKVEFVWTSTTGAGTPGGANIKAASGDQLVGEVRITPDSAGVVAYSVSLVFDAALEDELDLVSATELLPSGMNERMSPAGVTSTQESSGTQQGEVISFEAVSLGAAGPTSGARVVGVVTFDVNDSYYDGIDIQLGAFDARLDGVANNAYALVPPVFVGARVDPVGTSVPMLSRPALLTFALALLLPGLLALRHRHRTSKR